jgi:hypothetical protein
MKKKQICLLIAVLVSLCALVSLGATVMAVAGAAQMDSEIPSGMVMLTLVTLFCTVMIWRGVREMQE